MERRVESNKRNSVDERFRERCMAFRSEGQHPAVNVHSLMGIRRIQLEPQLT